MFKQLAELALQYLNQEQTNRAIERLAYEVQRTRDHDESERRMLALQLENEMSSSNAAPAG